MDSIYLLYTEHGFELQAYESVIEAERGADKLRQYLAYKSLTIDVVRVEPEMPARVVSTLKPKEQ